MNTKKVKNKSKSKPQKLPTKIETETLGNDQPLEDTGANLVVSKKKDEVVPALDVPDETPTPAAVEEKGDKIQTPKPPKRAKGKKKRDTSSDNANSAEDKVNLEASVVQNELIENIVPESTPVVPSTRKKKSKDKKANIEPKPKNDESENKNIKTEETSEKINLTEPNIDTLVVPEGSEAINQSAKVSKKKKKKKNRNDSEKSDKNENIECTLAFKKLLESSADDAEVEESKVESSIGKPDEEVNNIVSDDNTKNETKNDSEIVGLQSIDKVSEDESCKNRNKKKNKKGKQTQNKTDDIHSTETAKDEKENIMGEHTEEVSSDATKSEEKGKAKIIKPVEKKRKNKVDVESKLSESLDTPPNANKHTEDIKLSMDEEKPVSNKDNLILDIAIKSTEVDIKSETTLEAVTSLRIEEKCEELPLLQMSTDEIKQPVEMPLEETVANEDIEDKKEIVEEEFVEVKTAKKKKKHASEKRSNDTIQSETNKTHLGTSELEPLGSDISASCSKDSVDVTIQSTQKENVVDDTVKIEDIDDSSITIPDIIQYPRSTSQQLIDNNNNTLIQEISIPDEAKLGIPVFTEPPIIEGSGESPEVQPKKEQMHRKDVKVSELDSKVNTNIEGKTDIKSKMMEVSQDMEELRLSIERSLAELTAIEKDDDKTERKLQEVSPMIKKVPIPTLESLEQTTPSTSTSEQFKETEALKENVEKKTDEADKVLSTAINVCTISGIGTENQPSISTEKVTQGDQPKCPPRKDNKGKSKSKKKGKHDTASSTSCETTQQKESDSKPSDSTNSNTASESNKNEKTEQSSTTSQEKGKQQCSEPTKNNDTSLKQDDMPHAVEESQYDPIEKFEDALTSSVDDVNKTFEMIVNDIAAENYQNNPQINIIAPTEDNTERKKKENPVSKPKNLLGHPDIPVPSNKTDYKKEKNKTPNSRQATVQIKDSVDVDKNPHKESKESQTKDHKEITKGISLDSFSYSKNKNEDFIYKYSFRKVFLQSSCHVCKNELVTRVPCKYCSLIFYCSQKHMNEDWPRHQSLCFAVSTIAHMKDQKHLYADAKSLDSYEYRLLRMHAILSCEKILKRKLEAWEQEALLYPRMCVESGCREWRQARLSDCEGCGQISYCAEHPEHIGSHNRWCKSYALYKKMIQYQQTHGKLEPQLPTKVLEDSYTLETLNDALVSLFESKINMTDVEYAALTQLATAPLTTAFCHQLYTNKIASSHSNGTAKKSEFVVHSVGAELQFEADSLNKWEVFFLHLRPDIQNLRIALVARDLNPSNLPLEMLGKLKLCDTCRNKNRRITFSFQDKMNYHDYFLSEDYITPDIVCAFNPSIQRSSLYKEHDEWPSSVNCILKQSVPFAITSYTLEELHRDLAKIKEFGDVETSVVIEPKRNQFASVRPDRNFITDHEMPLQFKNYCYSVVCGGLIV